MEKKLSKKDLFWTWVRCYSTETCYNFERLQALGNTNMMLPVIEKLSDPKEEQIDAARKYMEFFNTEPGWIGPVIEGISVSMEEQRANGADIANDDILSLRTGLMGPIAGIGDTISQAVVYPILAGICCQFAIQGNIAGPLLFELIFKGLMIAFGYSCFMMGYRQGRQAIVSILKSGTLEKITEMFSVIGLIVIGNMAYTRVNIDCPLSFTSGTVKVVLQDVFDTLLPGFIPLLITLGVWALVKKKVKPTYIILIIFAVGIIGAYTGVLGVVGA